MEIATKNNNGPDLTSPLLPSSRRNEVYANQVVSFLPGASFLDACKVYKQIATDPNVDNYVIAQTGLHDRFFLLTQILNRPDSLHPWLYERCREVEADPDGYLDLWAREHYKSTIITFAGSIQEIIKDPEITIGIFSHSRPISIDFLSQIKTECENNKNLPLLWPHVFFDDPKKEAPTWSLYSGLIFRRNSNQKEATLEAWGLIDGMPTSKHFKLMIYDDIIDLDTCTPKMIQRATRAWEHSESLSAKNFDSKGSYRNYKRRFWHIGTRYMFGDTYGVILDRKAVKPRIYPATDTGTPDGKPVFFSVDDWEGKKTKLEDSTLACQYLQNPIQGANTTFKLDWIRYYEVRPETLNVAILCDPASSDSEKACNTAIVVIGMDYSYNKYLLDGVCHKLELPDKWKMIKGLRRKWLRAPGVQNIVVGYEKYGMQSDIAHFKEMMKIENYHFDIEEVNWPRVGEHEKDKRIKRLQPNHRNWQFFYPYDNENGGQTKRQRAVISAGKSYLVSKPIKREDQDGKLYNLVEWYITNEYTYHPNSVYKDMLDAMSRIYDLENFNPPAIYHDEDLLPEAVEDY
jgi:hypothetical protein